MKIAVNLFHTSPKSVTGAFVYITQILQALFEAGTIDTYYLFGESESVCYFRNLYGDMPHVQFRTVGIKPDAFRNPIRALHKLVAKIKHDYVTRDRIIAKEINTLIHTEGIDVYFSPASSIYPHGLKSVRKVTSVMDLQHEYFPENFPPTYLAERRAEYQYAVDHSDRLIAISEYTKKSLIEKCGAEPEKIRIIYFAPQKFPHARSTFVPPAELVFYPAALWPHKNHRVLIEALALLSSRFPALHAVCAGMVKGAGFKKELEALVESKGLVGRILFPGVLFGNDLLVLYQNAKALVFPSAFEGFGIPLVEAMSLGVPVIAADNSSIPEVVGDAGLLVPTGDAGALAEAITRVLTDNALRDTLIRKGRERAKLFSWEKAARETLAVFRSLGSE